MREQSVGRWLAIGLAGIGVASGVWLAVGSSRDARELAGGASHTPALEIDPGPPLEPTAEEPGTPPPDYHIEEDGRLSIDAGSLPASGVVRLGLALDEEALSRGQDPLSAVVISAGDARRLELSATPVAGPQSSVQLELDSTWLQAGLYMIQIRTGEKTPLPLRRWVLEVSGSHPADTP